MVEEASPEFVNAVPEGSVAAGVPRSDRGCLFCLRTDGGFVSVEHPIPESLGNSELVLPKGVVCDRCNNGPLAELDQCLTDFFPLKIRRTTLGIPNKGGKVPVTAFEDGRLEQVLGRAALTGPAPKSWKEDSRDPRDPRWSYGTAELRGGRPLRGQYAEQISRALLKVGFEASWSQHGERLMDTDFDELRDVVLGVRRRHGYVFVANQVDERDGGHHVHFDAAGDPSDNHAHLYVAAKMLGVYVATDSLRETPPPTLTPEIGFTATF
jgi:hypothetical protein